MDFLLECIGFPPDFDLGKLEHLLRSQGDAIPWRGPTGEHLRLPLSGGLEVHYDREEGADTHNLWPHFRSPHRLRVQVDSLQRVPDSPFDVLLRGIANPPIPYEELALGESYEFAAHLTDRRRIPKRLPTGHVLAVSVAGFALDISYVGPNSGVRDAAILENARGASMAPLGDADDPGGCMDAPLRVREVRHLINPITQMPVEVVEADAPGRPIQLFLSHWQLEQDGLPTPRPGWRIEGAFLFTGRIAGGLPSAAVRAPRFG